MPIWGKNTPFEIMAGGKIGEWNSVSSVWKQLGWLCDCHSMMEGEPGDWMREVMRGRSHRAYCHGEDFDLSHRRVLTRQAPMLPSEAQITQWLLRNAWCTTGKPQALWRWMCLSSSPPLSRGIPPTAPSEHPFQLMIPSGETKQGPSWCEWVRSHSVLQRQRRMM